MGIKCSGTSTETKPTDGDDPGEQRASERRQAGENLPPAQTNWAARSNERLFWRLNVTYQSQFESKSCGQGVGGYVVEQGNASISVFPNRSGDRKVLGVRTQRGTLAAKTVSSNNACPPACLPACPCNNHLGLSEAVNASSMWRVQAGG